MNDETTENQDPPKIMLDSKSISTNSSIVKKISSDIIEDWETPDHDASKDQSTEMNDKNQKLEHKEQKE